jgi:hypothetical protein
MDFSKILSVSTLITNGSEKSIDFTVCDNKIFNPLAYISTIFIDKKKIQQFFSLPGTGKQVQSFTVFLNYFRNFFNAILVQPFNKLRTSFNKLAVENS